MFDLKTSLLSRVDGLAELVLDGTKIMASVTGPIEPKLRQELPTLASLEIIVRPSIGVSTTREKLLEDKLRSLLQDVIIRYKYPRQLIQIVVQFLKSETNSQQLIGKGGHIKDHTATELSAAINAVYFALLDANVALYNSFASVPLAIIDDAVVVGPSLNQLQKAQSHHVVAFDIREKKASKILLVESQGTFTQDELVKVVEVGSVECERIHNEHQRPLVEQKINQDFVWRN